MRVKSPFMAASSRFRGLRSTGPSIREEKSGIHAGGRRVGKPGPEVRRALRLIQIVVDAEFGFVVCAAYDLDGAEAAELGIGRGAVADGGELRNDPKLFALDRRGQLRRVGDQRLGGGDDAVRLAVVASRGAATAGYVAVAHAADLAPGDIDA